jgi:hypothetical protein
MQTGIDYLALLRFPDIVIRRMSLAARAKQ